MVNDGHILSYHPAPSWGRDMSDMSLLIGHGLCCFLFTTLSFDGVGGHISQQCRLLCYVYIFLFMSS